MKVSPTGLCLRPRFLFPCGLSLRRGWLVIPRCFDVARFPSIPYHLAHLSRRRDNVTLLGWYIDCSCERDRDAGLIEDEDESIFRVGTAEHSPVRCSRPSTSRLSITMLQVLARLCCRRVMADSLARSVPPCPLLLPPPYLTSSEVSSLPPPFLRLLRNYSFLLKARTLSRSGYCCKTRHVRVG